MKLAAARRWSSVVPTALLWVAVGVACVFDPSGFSGEPIDGGAHVDVPSRDAGDWDALPVDWCDRDGDGHDAPSCGGDDCDDHDPLAYPGADELCDGLDNNCDGQVDEGHAGTEDSDGDGYSHCQGDCDDSDPTVYPFAPELCDYVDNDCDGDVDGDADCDGDGYSPRDGDCNDGDAAVYPYAPERCDGKDNDCDGNTDGDADCDGDGYATTGGDCDDSDPTVYPYAPELCDGKDNDCNTTVDEGCP